MNTQDIIGEQSGAPAPEVATQDETPNTTRLLEVSGWVVPRSEPSRDSGFECSVVTDGSCSTAKEQVATIDHNVELSPTGERTFDEDNNEWYFKANFEHGGQSYSAWFAEKQTEIDPAEALARAQSTQRWNSWLNGAGSSFGPNVEVADSEPAPYQLSMGAEAVEARSAITRYDANATYNVHGSEDTSPSISDSELNECFIERFNYYGTRGGVRIDRRRGTYRKEPETSTGYCYRYVKLILLDCGATEGYLPSAFAKNAGRDLIAEGFQKLDTLNPLEAPIGSIIVYDNKCDSTHEAGHIEIKTADDSYVSDFISSSPASVTRPRCRPVKGIYIR